VQSVERFQPTQAELDKAEAQAQTEAARGPATALRLRLDAAALPATVIDELRDLLVSFPGESEVVVELRTRAGQRMLRLGPDYRVERSTGLNAELKDLLGAAILAPAAGEDGLLAGAAA
jgi:DNA polymerase-3 subunit alpha